MYEQKTFSIIILDWVLFNVRKLLIFFILIVQPNPSGDNFAFPPGGTWQGLETFVHPDWGRGVFLASGEWKADQ